MFGLGLSEIIVIAIIGLLVIGPDELPKLARNIGRLLNEIKRTSDDFSAEIKNQVKVVEDLDESQKLKSSNTKPAESKEEQLELTEQVKTPSKDQGQSS
ncbi:MAG: Sec-independent protein translocase protein TatB [Bdellovibrionia bacterium]